MKVLLVNKFFYPKGGDAVVLFATADLLEKNGHKPIFFSMEDSKNLATPFSHYFIPNADLNNGGSIANQLRTAARILYSFQAKEKIIRLIDEEKPDIAHLHNICHQISPSIIDALKKRSIPVVMTLHDYKLTCPVYTLFSKNKLCERCSGRKFYNALLNKCTKGSIVKSFINMLEMYLHHSILFIYEKVDHFISPSRFLLEKTKEMGFPAEITHLSNFLNIEDYPEPCYGSDEPSAIYFGRLSSEKGLVTLCDAFKEIDFPLRIIGDGPQREELVHKVEDEGTTNISFFGHQPKEKLIEMVSNASFVVFPSEWYEVFGLTIIESFAMGKPVVGARIGGIPELVKDGETGLTFEPGNVADLRERIISLLNDGDKIIEMGKKARDFVVKDFDCEKHYQGLMEVYKEAIKAKDQ